MRLSLWCWIFLFLLFPYLCFAQSKKIPVAIDHEGEDSVGRGIAFSLKEAIRASQGFFLVDDSSVKARIVARMASVDALNEGNMSSIEIAIVYDSMEIPAGGIYLNIVAQNCGRNRIEACAKGILVEIDRQADRLRAKWQWLWKNL